MNFFKSSKKEALNNNNNECSLPDVADVRKILLERVATSNFNETDILRLKKEDYSITRYIKNDTDSTIKAIQDVLEWRKGYNLSELKEEDFPKEFVESKVFTIHGHDIDNNLMVYIRVKLFKKGQHPIDEVKKYLAFLLDKVDQQTRGDGWALCFDCNDAGISNVDMELLKFVVQALTNYFVDNCRYVLVFEMPWILSSIWKIVKSWLPQEQRDAVKFASQKDMASYVLEDQRPEYMTTKSCD